MKFHFQAQKMIYWKTGKSQNNITKDQIILKTQTENIIYIYKCMHTYAYVYMYDGVNIK